MIVKKTELSRETSSYHSNKGRLRYGNKFHNKLEFIVSGSDYYSAGQPSLFYKKFDTPAQNNGVAQKMDQDSAKKYFIKVSWGHFTLQGSYVGRKKRYAIASFVTIFNDERDATVDNRGYLDLKYHHEFDN